MAKDRFYANGTAETRDFFNCLEKRSNAPAAIWFRGLRKNITDVTFERAKISGLPMDHSEPPIYGIHVQSMMRAFARADSRDVRQLPGRARLDQRAHVCWSHAAGRTTRFGGAVPLASCRACK